jgi:hypothetical protein
MKARRGVGCLYQHRNRQGVRSGPWWIKYSVGGVPRYESTGTEDKQEAQRILNRATRSRGHGPADAAPRGSDHV